MARSRLFDREWLVDEALSGLSLEAEALRPRLYCIADRRGRLVDSARRIKAQCLPMFDMVSASDVERMLAELAAVGAIRRYTAAGARFIELCDFLRTQTPHKREKESEIPANPNSPGLAEAQPGPCPTVPVPVPVPVTVDGESDGVTRGAVADASDGLLADQDYHRRNCPPWASSACAAGVCVPRYLWPQWERRMGGLSEATSATLRMFVDAVVAMTPPGAGDRAEDLWPKYFAAHFGVTAPALSSGRRTATQTTLQTIAGGGGLRHHWRDECASLHGGRCESATFHDATMRERESDAPRSC